MISIVFNVLLYMLAFVGLLCLVILGAIVVSAWTDRPTDSFGP